METASVQAVGGQPPAQPVSQPSSLPNAAESGIVLVYVLVAVALLIAVVWFASDLYHRMRAVNQNEVNNFTNFGGS